MPLPKPDYSTLGYRCWHIEHGVALWCGPKYKANRRWYVLFTNDDGNLSARWTWRITRDQAAAMFQMRDNS